MGDGGWLARSNRWKQNGVPLGLRRQRTGRRPGTRARRPVQRPWGSRSSPQVEWEGSGFRTPSTPLEASAGTTTARLPLRGTGPVVRAMPRDVARAVTFLHSKSYSLTDSVTYERFVRLVDDAKRNEFIMIYIEPATNAAQPDKAFSARAQKGFAILTK